MILKKGYCLLIILTSLFSFSQKKNLKIKESENTKDKTAIYSNMKNEQIALAFKNKLYLSKVFVFYENKFYSVDTLKQIKNLYDYRMDIIEFPESITKDIAKLVILKKEVK